MIRFCLAVVAWAVLLCGCNSEPPLGVAKGKVTYKGQPATEGSVLFTDDSQGVAYVCDIDPQGNFVFQVAKGQGLPPGTYQVAIQPPRLNKPSMDMVPPVTVDPDKYPKIPKKYHDHKTSGFTATVKPGENEPFLFEMN
jgi:hypothetical protein